MHRLFRMIILRDLICLEVIRMPERYLCIYPDGRVSWIRIPHPSGRSQIFRWVIGCSCLEQVCTVIPDICIVVDESGRIKDPPQPLNPVASKLYAGSLYGDPIVGPAIVVAVHLQPPDEDGIAEYDWCPLNPAELAKLSLYLGIKIPD